MLLRPGGLPRAAIERVLGAPLAERAAPGRPTTKAPIAPGMLASHYAPRTRLRLNADRVEPGEALLAFGAAAGRRRRARRAACSTCRRAAISSRPRPICSRICARSMPAGAAAIAVMPVPHEGLGEAINDRLARAAAPATHRRSN